jgi:hypothetical protein
MSNKQEVFKPGKRYSIIKLDLNREVAAYNYQHLLQSLAATYVTKDNVNDDLTKDGRQALKAIEEKRKELTADPLEWHRDIQQASKELSDPLNEQIDRIARERKEVSENIRAEQAKQLAEENRIANAKIAIQAFVNRIIVLMGSATTDKDIVNIEMLIGSEKNRKNVYQEFIPDLISQCDGLRPQIKQIKETVRQLDLVREQQKRAIEDENMVAATELLDKKEALEQKIQDSSIRLHETAFEQASTIEIVVPEVLDTAPRGRTNWKWEVKDIKLLQKKMPHLVKVVPDDEAIELLLKTKRQDGSLDGKEAENWNGILFFNDRSYKR